MKRILYLSISHKYGLLAAFALVLLIKFILENVGIPPSLQPAMKPTSTILYWIYAASMINLMIFMLAVLITGNKTEEWWEEEYEKTTETRKDKLLTIWMKSFVVTLPITLYGSLFIGVMQSGWLSIAIMVIVISTARLLSTIRKKPINQ